MSTYSLTSKQSRIVDEAIALFSKQGYHATSTKSIADKAEVSEGLIFKTFGNKEGLLKAVLNRGEEYIYQMYLELKEVPDPKEVLRRAIVAPFVLPKRDYPFWILQYKLKWEMPSLAKDKIKPILEVLENAFRRLKYKDPDAEAYFLTMFLDAVLAAIIKEQIADKDKILQYTLKKYGL